MFAAAPAAVAFKALLLELEFAFTGALALGLLPADAATPPLPEFGCYYILVIFGYRPASALFAAAACVRDGCSTSNAPPPNFARILNISFCLPELEKLRSPAKAPPPPPLE